MKLHIHDLLLDLSLSLHRRLLLNTSIKVSMGESSQGASSSLAWQLRQRVIICTQQMAQLSHLTSHDHIATAFHFLRVNILGFSFLWSVLSMCVLLSLQKMSSCVDEFCSFQQMNSVFVNFFIFTYLFYKTFQRITAP